MSLGLDTFQTNNLEVTLELIITISLMLTQVFSTLRRKKSKLGMKLTFTIVH